MTVKISGTFPKDLLALNGLEEHRETIVETELATGPDEEGWIGWAVAKLSVKETTKKADGSYVPTMQIERIEVMEGAYVSDAKRMLLDTFRARSTDGVVDPVESKGSDFLRHGSGFVVAQGTREAPGKADPYENPDEAEERSHGRPVERVELPADPGDFVERVEATVQDRAAR